MITSGTLLYSFILFPTICIDFSNRNFAYGFTSVTFEWLRWYVGIKIYNKPNRLVR